MGYILTFDLGTTSVKTRVYDEALEPVAGASEEYGLEAGAGNVVELESELYWEAVVRGARKALASRRDAASAVAAIAVTTQGETLIPVDARGGALRKAIVWLDGRAVDEAATIARSFPPEDFYGVTGLPEPSGACPVAKVLWIKNKEPEVYAKTYKFMLLEDYVVLRLTGAFVSEKSLLSSTGYYDIRSGRYWEAMLDTIGIGRDKFPGDGDCGSVAGKLAAEAAAELGIGSGALVVLAAMDQATAALGAGNLEPGVVTETTGTALVAAATSDSPDFRHPSRPTIYRHVSEGRFLVMTVCNTAGIVLKWFRDEFCRDISAACAATGRDPYDAIGELVATVRPGSGGLVALPYFSGLVNPESCPAAKGVFFGVGLDTGRAHFAPRHLRGRRLHAEGEPGAHRAVGLERTGAALARRRLEERCLAPDQGGRLREALLDHAPGGVQLPRRGHPRGGSPRLLSQPRSRGRRIEQPRNELRA